MDRHAYLIMAHHQFDFLKELLAALDHERNDIYLHIDQKVSDFDFPAFSRVVQKSGLYFTQRLKVHWGGYSQTACELTLLKTALPGRYAYYHLLSGSDFPLKPQEEIHRFFEEHAGQEFLHFDSPQVPPKVRERITLYHFFRESSCPLAEPTDMLLTRLQRLLGINRLKGEPVTLQKGANWFSITHAFAAYVLSKEDWIRRHFRHSVCADELLLQTLAASSPFMERIFDPFGDKRSLGNLRYIDWDRGNENSPYTFQESDVELLRSLPHLFARKFDRNIFSQKRPKGSAVK